MQKIEVPIKQVYGVDNSMWYQNMQKQYLF